VEVGSARLRLVLEGFANSDVMSVSASTSSASTSFNASNALPPLAIACLPSTPYRPLPIAHIFYRPLIPGAPSMAFDTRLRLRSMNGATSAIPSAMGRVVQFDVFTLGGRSRIGKNGVQFDDDPSNEHSHFGSIGAPSVRFPTPRIERIGWGLVFTPLALLHLLRRENGRRMNEDQHIAARRNGDARRCVIAVVALRARCEGSRENTNAAVEQLDRSAPSDLMGTSTRLCLKIQRAERVAR